MNFWFWTTIAIASIAIIATIVLLCWQSLKDLFAAMRQASEKMSNGWQDHTKTELHPITPPDVLDPGIARLKWQENKIERLRRKNLRRQKYRKTWQKWLP